MPPKKAKTWDHTVFTKPGQRKSTTKSQGKKRALPDSECEDDERDEELVEFEQFPSPFIQGKFMCIPFYTYRTDLS